MSATHLMAALKEKHLHRLKTWNKIIGTFPSKAMLLLRRLPGILYTHRYSFYTGIVLFVTFAYLLFRWNLICSNIQAWQHINKAVSLMLSFESMFAHVMLAYAKFVYCYFHRGFCILFLTREKLVFLLCVL